MNNVDLTVESSLVSSLIPSPNSPMITPPQPGLYLPANEPSLIGANLIDARTLEDLLTPTLFPEETSPKLPLARQFSKTNSVSIAETLLSKNTITGVSEQEDLLTNSALSLNAQSTQGETSDAIPVWHSGFENGFPGGEWHKYNEGSYSPVNKKAPGQKETWTILDSSQAAAEGVPVLEGDSLYKGWIHGRTRESHRAYTVLHLDQINTADYPNGIPSPIVNRFYVWADWQTKSTKDWMHFLTLGSDPKWDVVTMSARGPNRRLELAHVGDLNGFDEGDGWERLNDAYMPLRQWVRFTVYVDFRAGNNLMYVWMDGKPILRANGENLKQDSPHDTSNLLRAHWGLYSRGSLNNGVQYNDSIQLWQLTQPLTDFSEEPISPYDGTGRSFESTGNSDELSLRTN